MGSAQMKPSKLIEVPDIESDMEADEQEVDVPVRKGDADADHAKQRDTAKEGQQPDQDSDKQTEDGDDETEEKKKGNKKLELTPEEMEDYQNDHVARLQELIKGAQSKDSLTDEDGEFISEVKAVVMKMYQLYFQMNKVKKVPLAVLIAWRRRVAAVAMETKTLDMMCDIVKQSYPDKWIKEDGHLNYLLKFTILALLNFSDASADFAVSVANYPGFCEKLKEILEDTKEGHINHTHSASRDKFTQWAMSVTHNLSMAESNIGRLREIEILPILVEYLKTPKEMFRLITFATLSGIINEKESEIIRANITLVAFLLKVLSKGMATRLHRHNGWSCKECTLTVRMLARNDANKKLLVELGALELLAKLGTIGNEEEQYEAVSALWALSFDPDNSKKICNEAELCVVDLFLDLKNSDVKQIRKACEGALWTLREDLKSSVVEKYKNIAASTPQHQMQQAQSGKQKEDDGHVMISYQWADQKTLMVVRDKLKAAGVKVWMDIDQMGGSTVESMAIAVEQAKVILMCMSQKYKNSPNCRAEAEYAYQKQRMIIPLKMERGYMPDGWLGFICGAKLFFDFGGKYSFDDKMEKLLREITNKFKGPDDTIVPTQAPTVMALSSGNGDQVDSSPVPRTVSMATTRLPISSKTIKTIRQWKSEDVRKWIEHNDLNQSGVSKLTGGEIAMLVTMYHRAPEFFFKCLQDMLKVKDLLNMSKIVLALEDLSEGV